MLDSLRAVKEEHLGSVEDYGRAARERLPRPMWDALFGDFGADWATELNNVRAFDATKLRPRVLMDISARIIATTALGVDIRLPVIIAPSGSHQRYHAEGELATARAAVRAGTIMALSTASTYSIEEVAAVSTGPRWFQLYFLRDRKVTERLVRRAEDAGYRAIVLTVDNSGTSSGWRSVRFSAGDGASYDLHAEHKLAPTIDPAREYRNFQDPGIDRPRPIQKSDWKNEVELGLNWEHVDWLRGVTTLPLVIKGIQTGADARLCAEHGVDGLVVSNHGGFALKDARGTIETLPEVVARAGPVEVYLDGGVRRGTDVLKAVALGARAVLVGRAQAWGLTVGGEDGITRVLEILAEELDDAMRFCGVPDITRVDSSLVIPAPGATPPGTLVEDLERLAALYENGGLTEAEFARAKNQLLGAAG
jgi:4-hydroxymandelate oxidase